jgi:hypothetical protein
MGPWGKLLAAALVGWSARAAAQAPTPSVRGESPAGGEAAAQTLSADDVCHAIEQAAGENGLPVEFLARVIWQESRFNTRAVSRKGAKGIAQFMPATAHLRGLANPFDAVPALHKAAGYLADLRKQFGNLGLAAAGYNAGPGRVAAWLAGTRALPRETRDYVEITTGRAAGEWALPAAPQDANTTAPHALPCTAFADLIVSSPSEPEPGPPLLTAGLIARNTQETAQTPIRSASEERPAVAKAMVETPAPDDTCCAVSKPAPPMPPPPMPRWGLQLAANWSEDVAWASYRRIDKQYASVLGDHTAIAVETRAYGQGSAIRYAIRIGGNDWPALQKLCNKLIMAGGACVVLPNRTETAAVP